MANKIPEFKPEAPKPKTPTPKLPKLPDPSKGRPQDLRSHEASKEAQKGAKVAKETHKKLKKGTKEYKKVLAELTDIDVDSANKRMKKIKIAGSETNMKKEKARVEKQGKDAQDLAEKSRKDDKTLKGPSSGTPKREGLA